MTSSLPKGSRTRAHRPIVDIERRLDRLAARAHEDCESLVDILDQNIGFRSDTHR